jgi:hypothetical protein
MIGLMDKHQGHDFSCPCFFLQPMIGGMAGYFINTIFFVAVKLPAVSLYT